MKSALLTLLLIPAVFCAITPVDGEVPTRPLPTAEALENRDYAVRIRKAAQECAQILVIGGPYESYPLRAQEKAELCYILNRVQPVQYYHLYSITREWLAIRFTAADGSEIMTMSIYDFGNPQTLTDSTKIWLSEADEQRLLEILQWN